MPPSRLFLELISREYHLQNCDNYRGYLGTFMTSGSESENPYRRFAKARALCIDNNQDTLDMMDFALRNAGFVCRTAASCDSAKQHIDSTLFDIYIIGNWLPDGSGIE